jgi:mxaJ protein
MRSAWSMVYVKGRGLDYIKSQTDLKSLTDEKRNAIRVGIWDQGPATDWISRVGLMEQAVPYVMQSGDAKVGPTQILDDLVQGKINLTFVWGPIAGYYAKKTKDAEIVVIPMQNEFNIKFDYQIAMAVREKDKAWKAQINRLIDENRTEIENIIKESGVPLLTLQKAEDNGEKH